MNISYFLEDLSLKMAASHHFLVDIRNDENIKVSENGTKITISLVGLSKLFTYKGEII